MRHGSRPYGSRYRAVVGLVPKEIVRSSPSGEDRVGRSHCHDQDLHVAERRRCRHTEHGTRDTTDIAIRAAKRKAVNGYVPSSACFIVRYAVDCLQSVTASGKGVAVARLRLDAVEFIDLTRWRWVLTDEASGELDAEYEVQLDASCWQFEAFTDLMGYLSLHVAPDRRAQDEARIVAELGEWIGSQVFGPVAAAMAQSAPVDVRVVVSESAEELLSRPLELAHIRGMPLAVQDVTFVIETGRSKDRSVPVGERLRVLGLFSLPEGSHALNLRRERHSLVQLIKGIAAHGKAADVRVLQYGVTRDRLRDVLADGAGWDIIHISGHGSPGRLLLETDEGRPDYVTAAQLAELLDVARGRLKLVAISACWSAAAAVSEQRRLLGVPDGAAPERAGHSGDTESVPSSLATELASQLGCAVLAMRYPVGDEFAIALSEKLYELLVDQGHSLPRAVGMALRELVSGTGDSRPEGTVFPGLALATLALFGRSAMDLRLAAPAHGHTDRDEVLDLMTAGFPPQPERFVGRTAVMARASAALATHSGVPGVLLHGMPGGGKTACALELAYAHEHGFDWLIWYKAPDEGMDITSALNDFALTLERHLDGFQMTHLLVDDHLTAFLPTLTQMMEQCRLLIVIDNGESLLTETGRWRDERWAAVMGALTSHTGQGRLILTTRRIPVGLTELQMETVDTLSADESLLLVRELPHLRKLSHGDVPGISSQTARQLARRALEAAQGHPTLLELADGQASHPDRLARLLNSGGRARVQGGLPDGFFTAGEATVSASDYLDILTIWTRMVTKTLKADERVLFWLLCCLEESDRQKNIIDRCWLRVLESRGNAGLPPSLDHAFAAVGDRGLATVREDAFGDPGLYAIHPAVAAAGRAQAGNPFRDAVDTIVAEIWFSIFREVYGGTGDGKAIINSELAVRAGLSAVPYLMRKEQWENVAALLDRAFNTDPTRTNAVAMLPIIQRIIAHEPRHAVIFARILRVLNPETAQEQMRVNLDTALATNDYRAAVVISGHLVNQYRESGQLAEALALAKKLPVYTRLAGLGPWSQMQDTAQRLQILQLMGKHKYVLSEVKRLHGHMQKLSAAAGENDASNPWNVRETLLGAGRDAAREIGKWQDALDLNALATASKQERNASTIEITRSRFNDYFPLLELNRTDEALDLLRDCRQVFSDANDVRLLGRTFAALAHIEYNRSHREEAIRLQHNGLRYSYLANDALAIATGYTNLGTFIGIQGGQPTPALACHLAAHLIFRLTGSGETRSSMFLIASGVRHVSASTRLPANVADLDREIGNIPGTNLADLIATLSPDADAADQILRTLSALAWRTRRRRWR